MKYNVAVVGATGVVGREIVQYLASRKFPSKSVRSLASDESAGTAISFGTKDVLTVERLEGFDFENVDIAFFSAGSAISRRYVEKATKKGCIVIDNTSAFRMDPDVPLVIPEVNPLDIADYNKKNIISNPNCSTIQMLVILKPLHDTNKIKRVVVSTYQSVSGAGKKAMDELYNHTKKRFAFNELQPEVFAKPITFNCIPHIGDFLASGYTEEEIKMHLETQKIMHSDIQVSATCVRVPVFVGHSEAVSVEFENEISVRDAVAILDKIEGIVIEEPKHYTTPIEVVHEEAVFVSRIRKDISAKNSLVMWIVADNIRKGAALNAIQIAEVLVTKYLSKSK